MSDHSELARLLEHPAIWRGTSVAQTEVLPSGFGALDQRLPGGGWPRSGLIEILVSCFGVGELTLFLPTLAALTRQATARWSVFVAPPLEPFPPALAAHGVILDRLLVVRATASKNDRSRRKSSGPLWAFEQSLGSGACDVVMAWSGPLEKRPAAVFPTSASFPPAKGAAHALHGLPASVTLVRREHTGRAQQAATFAGCSSDRLHWPQAREIRRLQLAAERGRALGVLFRPIEAAQEASHAVLRMALEPVRHGVRATLLKSRGGVPGAVELSFRPSGT